MDGPHLNQLRLYPNLQHPLAAQPGGGLAPLPARLASSRVLKIA